MAGADNLQPLSSDAQQAYPRYYSGEFLSTLFSKHDRQNISAVGSFGWNSTSPIWSQPEHLILKNSASTFFRLIWRQFLQRAGLFLNPLSLKNFCSPTVQINSSPQSLHLRVFSTISSGPLVFVSSDISCILPISAGGGKSQSYKLTLFG